MHELKQPFWNNISPHVKKHGARVTKAGIRIGTLMYFGFGQEQQKEMAPGRSISACPFEVEIGADIWMVYKSGLLAVDSSYYDVMTARAQLEDTLIGLSVCNFLLSCNSGTFYFSEEVEIKFQVRARSASGFTLSLLFDNEEQSWETVDLQTISG